MLMSVSSLYLDAFSKCAKTGHFTRAAEMLHITQSALSQRIANLEDELETTLFIRERSGIRLTPSGQELLRFCTAKESLEEESIEKIKSRNSKELSGTVRIGGFSSVMRSVALPALSPLLNKNSKVQLQLISKEMVELPVFLKSGEIDYMILYHELIRDDIETVFLGDEKNLLVEKPGYLGPHIFLDHDENDETSSKYLRLKKSKKSFGRRYLDDVYGIIDGVKLGIGRAVVPIHLIKDDPGIHIVDRKTILKIPVVLHYYRQPFYTQLHQEVVKHLKRCSRFLE